MSEPVRYRIRLEDLVLKEARDLAKVMKEPSEVCPWNLGLNDRDTCLKAIKYIETKSERLASILANITRYDHQSEYINLVKKAVTILAQAVREPIGISSKIEGRCLRMYPLILTTYSIFIVGVQERKDMLLESLLNISLPIQYGQSESESLAFSLETMRGYSYDLFKTITGINDNPLAIRVAKVISPWVGDLLADEESSFFQGELVLKLGTIKSNHTDYFGGKYIYFYKAIHPIKHLLGEFPHWLDKVYPNIEDLLRVVDERCPELFPGAQGFCKDALATYKGKTTS